MQEITKAANAKINKENFPICLNFDISIEQFEAVSKICHLKAKRSVERRLKPADQSYIFIQRRSKEKDAIVEFKYGGNCRY